MLEMYGHDVHDQLLAQWSQPWAPLRDTWGTDQAAVAGQAAMMALAGGPAPPRTPRPDRTGSPAAT